MNRIVSLLLASVLLFFAGCTDSGTSINQPASSSKKELIKIPPKSGLTSELQISLSQLIDGDEGGSMILSNSYVSLNGNIVSINADLEIPEGAFNGNRNITMTADDQDAALDFSPHMVFDNPLTLTLTFTGLDLSSLGLSNGNVGFFYVDDSGNLTAVPNSGIFVNVNQGTIRVRNAQISHFSRYAFAQ